MDPTLQSTTAAIPPPPGYSQDQVIDNPASIPLAATIPPPPPPGYSADQVIDNPALTPTNPAAGFTAPRSKRQSALTMQDYDSFGTKALKGVGGLFSGIGEGVFGTAAGAADILHLPSSTLHNLAGDNETQSRAENIGQGTETLAEFLLGDEALKGLALSDKLAKASKAAKLIESSPMLQRVFQAGVRAVRGGAVGAIQGTVKSGGDVSEGIASGTGAGIGNAVLPEVFPLLKAAPGAIKSGYTALSEALQGAEKVVQPELQSGIGKILKDVAADHGIVIPEGTALRDSAEHVGQSIKSNASAIYKSIDDALGGQDFKSVNRQLDAAQRALNEDVGIDHDYTGRLIERINHLEDFKAQLRQTALDAGVPKDAFEKADRLWRQGSAMQDLSAKIRQSTSGLPDSLRDGSPNANNANSEVISPSKLAPKIHMLRDSGRLSQALTQDLSTARGNDLLRTVEGAKARTADIANTSKLVGKVVAGAAKGIGAGAAGGLAYEAGKHLAGN